MSDAQQSAVLPHKEISQAAISNMPVTGLRGDYTHMRADYTTDQSWRDYTAAEHQLWQRLYERQVRIAKRYAADSFLAGLIHLNMPMDRIPRFDQASEVIHRRTRWQIVAVPGLIPDDVFFAHLSKRQFPVTVWLRKPEEMDYLVEPDVFHDFFGHVPLLTQPVFADYLQEYGRKGAEALELNATKLLARLFWYMVEFGLIKSPDGIKAYGAGMLSSATETAYSVDSEIPNRIMFRLERVMQTDYRIDSFQSTYFVLERFDDLFNAMRQPFAPIYHAISGSAISADEIVETDVVVHAGKR
ncbi:phenylalanine 4-monooxygenase [Dongia soli]|uniref:Phenylalanine-4-hydroxylase n=1 Tax=Dongia soli TaxID=600628 RepID=A0ABU5EA26_9PROT|nr:phenylalanine 4-monooxygenase [Dongia soli]MDY0882757.1 phenylalanine 4-monooxygenase [Dongia soli]